MTANNYILEINLLRLLPFNLIKARNHFLPYKLLTVNLIIQKGNQNEAGTKINR